MYPLRLAVLAALLACGLPDGAEAQLVRGAISGTVLDSTGAAMPGVNVTLTNNATGTSRTVQTDASGFYRAPALDPGTYTVKADLQGFKSVENRAVRVEPSLEATLDLTLEVGQITETVDVTAQSEGVTLNKTSGTLAQTFTARQATDLPLSADRAVTNLALLAPNVSNASSAGPDGRFNIAQTNVAANGQRGRNNNFMIDGTDNNDISVTLPTVPVPPESVAEFTVQTNPYNAEFGRNTGAQLNIITKSGSNRFSGSVFEYFRDSDLNARTNLEKEADQDEPTPFERHQFGGGLGGPIVRNRAFFYGVVQRDKNDESTLGQVVRIPTPAGLQTLRGVPLRDGQSAASRQAVLDRLAFLEDVYAQGPAFRNVNGDVLVNGVPIETGQMALTRDTPFESWYYFARGDVALFDADTVTGRYVRNAPEDQNLISNSQFGSIFTGDQLVVDQNLSVSHTKVLGTTALNEARFSWINRDLSFPENDPDSPTAGITGLFTIGGAANFPQGRVQDSYQFMDVLTFQRGRHSLKAGVDIRYINLDSLNGFNTKGTFTFNSLQDYLNNSAVSFTQALQTASYEATQWSQYYFVQDDWRPTPNLTINLGLRYEYNTVPLGFLGAEQAEVRAALVPGPAREDTNNWAPRVGFAWSPNPRGGMARWLFGEGASSIRGGYGMSYDVLFYNILTVNANNYPRVFEGRLDNAIDVYPNVAPVTGGLPPFNPLATFVNTPEDIESPESHLWSLSWQRELAQQFVFEVGYTGSLGRKGIAQFHPNYAVLTPEQAATVRTTLSTTSIPTVQARRLFPQYGARILIAGINEGEYHAVFASFNKRFADGLQFGASYTYGRAYSDGDESLALAFTASSPQVPQDFANLGAEWSPSAFDRPHRLVAHWIYEVPWFEGGFAGNAVLRHIFGGWQFAGVAQAQSGRPFTILTGVDSNGNGAGGDRPNVGGGRLVPDAVTDNFRTFTNEGAYVAPLGSNGLPIAFSLGNGNAPRNGLRGPGFVNWDLSLTKRIRFLETQAIRIRADFLNAFNQDDYGNPVSNMTSPDFGRNVNDWGARTITLSIGYSF